MTLRYGYGILQPIILFFILIPLSPLINMSLRTSLLWTISHKLHMWNESEEWAIPQKEIDWKQGVGVTFFFLYCNITWCFFTRVSFLVPSHYLHSQDQRWSLMGWTIHSSLTGGIQSGMPITQATINLSKTFLDQSLEEEEKTGPLTN